MTNATIKDFNAASQLVRMSGSGVSGSPLIAHHIIGDEEGNRYGITGSPLPVSFSATSLSAIQGTPACPAAAWTFRLTDLTDSVAVTAASELLVSVNNSPSVIINSGSVVVTNGVSASISNSPSVVVSSGSIVVTNALSASISNTLTASAIQGVAACPAAAWPTRITDLTDTVAVTAASELLTFINNSPSVVVSS